MKKVRDLLVLAACGALLAAVVECATYLFQGAVLGHIPFRSGDIFWFAPVSYALFFLPFTLALVVVTALQRGLPLSFAVGFLGFLTALGIILPYASLASWARVLLAAGIAVRCAQVASRSGEKWLAASRRVALACLAVLALLAGATKLAQVLRERRAMGSLPSAAADAPNILLIVFDTVRRGELGLYGYPRNTSAQLQRVAAEGLVFDRAMAPAPWTLPSHVSLFTGRLPTGPNAGNWERPARLSSRTLAAVLRSHGYATGGFSGNLSYAAAESGVADGFVHFEDFPVTARQVLLHSSFGRTRLFNLLLDGHSVRDWARALGQFNLNLLINPSGSLKPSRRVVDGFLAWQGGLGSHPFFAFLNFFDAHRPYRPPAGFERVFAAHPEPRDLYDGAIAYMDQELGRLVDSLRRRGVLDRTILVVTADHGEQFGEHNLHGHANSLYMPLLEVPLVIRYPRAVAAGRTSVLCSTADVPATLLDLAGAGSDRRVGGVSLARFWRGSAPVAVPTLALLDRGIRVPRSFPNFGGDLTSLFDGRFEYIDNAVGADELYDVVSDSLEQHNLADSVPWGPDLTRMRRLLDSALLTARRDPPGAADAP